MSDKKTLESMRLDKWLWCARFFKTRALAAAAIKNNKVKVDGDTVKPSRSIVTGANVLIRKPPFEYDIRILKLSPNRVSGSLAAQLYEETAESIARRELLTTQLKAEAAAFPRTRGRPTKRDRRHIIRFTRIDSGSEND
ncbi:MAG: S4 domain-containing protein [Gammaproteobacteria bacterium]